LIAQLNAGADFAALAQEFSIGPSGPNGGKLGSFGPGQMVAPFEEAAFALSPGSFSQSPVETQFGFHVIYLEDLGGTEPESYEALLPTIRDVVQQQVQSEIREELRVGADLVVTAYEALPKQ